MAKKSVHRGRPRKAVGTSLLDASVSRRKFLQQMVVVSGGLVAASCLPGSGGGANVAKSVTINYWYWVDSPEIGQFFQRTIDKFNSSQKTITVVGNGLANNETTRQKIVQTAAAGGGGPDASFATTDWLQDFYTGHILEPVQSYFDKWPNKSDIPTKVVEVHRIKSGQPLLYLPWGAIVDIHYYRKDLYDKAGLSAPATFTDLVNNAKALTKPGVYGFGMRGADQYGFLFNFVNYLLAEGIVFTDGKGGTGLDTPEAISFATGLFQLYWDHIAQASALQDRFPQMVAQFQAGKLAQWGAETVHGPLLAGANNEYLPVLGVSIWPKGTTGKAWSTLSTEGNIILKQSKNKDAAWEFINFLNQPDVITDYATVNGTLPVRTSVAAQPGFASKPWNKVSTDSAPYYGVYPFWHKNWLVFSTTTGVQVWQQGMQKSVSPTNVMKQLANLMRDI